MYDDVAGGSVSFVGDLCSGRNVRVRPKTPVVPVGERMNPCGSPEGYQAGGESQTAGLRGEFLVFSTYAQLTSEDTNTAKDVYRYDAESGVVFARVCR